MFRGSEVRLALVSIPRKPVVAQSEDRNNRDFNWLPIEILLYEDTYVCVHNRWKSCSSFHLVGLSPAVDITAS